MARNRQRASERKGRRRAEDEPGNGSGENLHRDDVPGALDHASGDVDEVEASIVAGAHGEPAPLEDDVVLDEEDGDVDDGDDDDGGSPPIRTADGAPAHGRGGPRFLNFLRACWAELQRVQWPDRRAVGQATAVVLGFVVVAGAFLGLIDALAKQVVQLIL